MPLPVQINLFDDDTEADIELLNSNFRRLAAAINDIAGTQVVGFQSLPADESSGFLPITGGTMQGTLTVPGIQLIHGQSTINLISENDVARTVKPGLVKQGVHVQSVAQGNSVAAALDALIDSLRGAGVIANAS